VNRLLTGFIFIVLGISIGYFAQSHIREMLVSSGLVDTASEDGADAGAREVLYWVAPMDANYRRDQPGKSPMGMDLVPVYADEGSSEAGVVKINPTVVNNLGVRTAKAELGVLNRDIDTVGYIGFDEEKIFHVHTRVEGWIERLLVKSEGEKVSKGQKLFEIYSPDLVNAQEEYLSALNSKNQFLIQASEQRLRLLGIGAQQVKRLQESRKVRQRIDYFAEHTGFLNELNIREGMFVKPATDVLSIGQLDTVWVIAEVFEQQASWISSGQDVDMTVTSMPGRSWSGKVDYIYPVLDASTRTLRVRVRFDNPDFLLKPNMYVRLQIHAATDQQTVYIPREALIRSGSMDRVVLALGDGRYKSVVVNAGIESDASVEILEGLSKDDVVVTSAQFLIDSESSLTAEFGRMQDAEMTMSQDANPDEAWVDGKVTAVMPGHNMLTVQHQPVDAWGWPEMVMDFTVNESIAIDDFKPGSDIRMRVRKLESGGLEVVEIEAAEMDTSMVWVDGEVTKVAAAENRLTVQHQPVDAWGWPVMTMDFNVAGDVPIAHLQNGEAIRFQVKKLDSGGILVVAIDDDRVAWVKGRVNQVNTDQRKLNMDHQPVDAWDWPVMTMDFPVADAVDIKQFQQDQQIQVLVLKKESGGIEIIDVRKEP
jgi:Cu(I)/Ag(I) efflux system membrane fusion protein